MARRFDLHRLQLLRELKHRGTITAVAAAMSYSHSAVSQQLAVLEGEIGTALLEPDGRRVRLTPQAEILVGHVEAILERLEEADADVIRSTGEVSGTVRIAGFQTAILALLPAALTILRQRHPNLMVELTQAEPEVALPALQVRDFDLVISEAYAGQPLAAARAVDQVTLRRDTLRFAAPQRDGRPRDVMRVADLQLAHWVMEPAGGPAREWAVRTCHSAGFEPDVRYESSDMFVHERLVRHGHAAAFLPDLFWFETVPTLALYPVPSHGYRRIVSSIRKGTAKHPAIRATHTALRVACAQADAAIAANLRDLQ